MNDPRLELAENLNALGELYHFQGKYSGALEKYEAALKQYKEVKLKDGNACAEEIAAVQANLGRLYDDRGDYEKAEDRYKLALTPKNLASALGLARLYHYRWQEYTEAAKYYDQAMEMCTVLKGDHNLEFSQIRVDRTQLDLDLDRYGDNPERYREAERARKDAVDTCRRAVERDVPYAMRTLVRSLSNLAEFYRLHRRYDQARPVFEEAVRRYKQMEWTKHFSYADILAKYARLLQVREGPERTKAYNCYNRAEQLYSIEKSKYYPFYPVGDFLNGYASFFCEAKDYYKARELYKNAIDIYSRQIPCLGHDQVIEALESYASYSNGRDDLPETAYKAILDGYGYEVLDVSKLNPQIANVICSYARFQADRNDKDNARILYEKALAIYYKALEGYEQDLISKQGRIELILQKLVDTLKGYTILLVRPVSRSGTAVADRAYEQALTTHKQLLGDRHQLLADIYASYSRYLEIIDDQEESEKYAQKARNIRRKNN